MATSLGGSARSPGAWDVLDEATTRVPSGELARLLGGPVRSAFDALEPRLIGLCREAG